MKKRILSCLMALALCLTLLPATAQAEDGHAHCLCGKTSHVNIGDHKADKETTFATRLSYGSGKSTWFSDGEPLKVENNQWLLPEGCYYLDDHTSDTYVTKYTIKITGNVTICLNGQEIEKIGDDKAPVFEVTNGYVLTLTDCKGSGKVTHSSMEKEGSGVYVNGSTLNLYEGQIAGNNGRENSTSYERYGGGVYVIGGTFNMYGGAITENDANYGGGVYVKGSTFNMYGGTIKSNESSKRVDSGSGGAGVYVESGNFIMNNTASVTENTIGRESNGGGVYVKGGTFEMHNDASVADNKATYENSCGAGVYVSGGTFEMHNDASVTENKAFGNGATLNGAGVYVTGRNTTFTMHNSARVTGNAASGTGVGDNDNGGGVYVSVSGQNGKFEMNDSASVTGNTATGYGGGVYVKSGTFTMNYKASVSSNQAKNGGGVYASGGSTFNMNGEATSVSNNKATQYGGVFVSDNATFTVSDKPTVTGNTKIGAGSADSNVYLAGNAYITIADHGLHGSDNSIGVTKLPDSPLAEIVIAEGVNEDYSRKFFSDDKTREVKYDTDNKQLVLKNKETQPPTHTHSWTYRADKATITATCTNTDGNCDNTDGGSVTITAPEHKTYGDGNSEKAQLTKDSWQGKKVDVENIQYSTQDGAALDTAPTEVGKYKASITVEGQTASVVYEITGETIPSILVTQITLNTTTATLKVGDTKELTATVTPENATNPTLTWESSAPQIATVANGKVTALKAGKATITVKATDASGKSATCEVTVTAATTPSQPGGSTGGNTGGSSSGSSSSGSYDSNPIIKTETKNNADGSTTKTETRKDGTVTATTTAKDGSTSKTETKKDGSSVTENKAADGSTGTVKTDKNGQTEANAKVSAKAVEAAKKSGEAVKAPVEVEAARNSSAAPTVKVELPQNSGKTEVEIPVSNAKPGTVAVLVHPDDTEEILKASAPTENGIRLTVDGSATVKIIDNSKDFVDTQNHWAKDEIDFVSARELVNGISATRYAPDASATRAQLWTILARQNDADLTGGANWYEKAQLWSKDKGISDGTEPNAAINRAQMVTMLWRTMGQPAATDKVGFADVPAGSYYAQAVAWAVESGITTGVGGGRFDPAATCTRAQIAAFLARSMK